MKYLWELEYGYLPFGHVNVFEPKLGLVLSYKMDGYRVVVGLVLSYEMEGYLATVNWLSAISVISVSSDSFEDSVGTPAGRVILFDTIPTTIPDTTPIYTPASPEYSHASDSESDPSEDPSSDHIPPLPATSPFLSSDDDTTDSDTPPSPTHDTPFTVDYRSTPESPIIPRRRVMLLAPGQPIPHGRPYRYHLNGPVHMMTTKKRVRQLPTQRLAVRHLADHSSSDSSSEASSDLHSDASSDPSLRHSLYSGYLADVEVDPRETSLRDDAIVGVSDEPHLEQDSDPKIQAKIDECCAYADALRDRGIDARVVVEAIDRDETETGVRGPVEVRVERVTHPVMPEDIPELAQEGAVEATYETLEKFSSDGSTCSHSGYPSPSYTDY
ncbi:hypothetical protein Tco_0779282 [Tanacetum coccineum]